MFGASAFSEAPFSSEAGVVYQAVVSEAGACADSVLGFVGFLSLIAEAASVNDQIYASLSLPASVSEASEALDLVSSSAVCSGAIIW